MSVAAMISEKLPPAWFACGMQITAILPDYWHPQGLWDMIAAPRRAGPPIYEIKDQSCP